MQSAVIGRGSCPGDSSIYDSRPLMAPLKNPVEKEEEEKMEENEEEDEEEEEGKGGKVKVRIREGK